MISLINLSLFLLLLFHFLYHIYFIFHLFHSFIFPPFLFTEFFLLLSPFFHLLTPFLNFLIFLPLLFLNDLFYFLLLIFYCDNSNLHAIVIAHLIIFFAFLPFFSISNSKNPLHLVLLFFSIHFFYTPHSSILAALTLVLLLTVHFPYLFLYLQFYHF